MQAFSSSPPCSSSSNYSLLSSQNTNPSKFQFCIPFKNFHSSPSSSSCSYSLLHPIRSHKSSSSSAAATSSSPLLQEKPQVSVSASQANDNDEDDYQVTEKIRTAKKSLEELLVVRKPVMDSSGEEEEEEEEEDDGDDDDDEATENESANESFDVEGQVSSSSMSIDDKLSKFAKNMPIFEPERIATVSGEKPLLVNLDLALYRAKILTRNYQYQEAENILRKCIYYWPEDGRSYVALGKVLSKQSKVNEARAVYEKGCQATQGENPYVWQVGFDVPSTFQANDTINC